MFCICLALALESGTAARPGFSCGLRVLCQVKAAVSTCGSVLSVAATGQAQAQVLRTLHLRAGQAPRDPSRDRQVLCSDRDALLRTEHVYFVPNTGVPWGVQNKLLPLWAPAGEGWQTVNNIECSKVNALKNAARGIQNFWGRCSLK